MVVAFATSIGPEVGRTKIRKGSKGGRGKNGTHVCLCDFSPEDVDDPQNKLVSFTRRYRHKLIPGFGRLKEDIRVLKSNRINRIEIDIVKKRFIIGIDSWDYGGRKVSVPVSWRTREARGIIQS